MAMEIPQNGVANDHGAHAPFADDDGFDANTGFPHADRAQLQRDAIRDAKWESLLAPAPADWYLAAPAKRNWLLRDSRHAKARGVLPLGKVGQLIAEGGAGKTMVLCQLAVSVATGAPFLGVLSVASPGRVLLVLGEEDAEEARRRLYRAEKANRFAQAPADGAIVVLPLAGVHAPMLELDGSGNLSETCFLRWLRGYVKAGDFRLVGIDPLSRFGGPDAETDNAAATQFIQALESLVSPTTTVLNAHHVNKVARANGKLDATSGRGSSALVDGARWQCALSVERLDLAEAEERARFGEIVTFAVTKSNYAAKPDPIVLRRDLDNGGALVPVNDDDMATIDAGRTSAGPSATRSAARQAATVTREQQEDRAVLWAVSTEPGLSTRALIPKVRARLSGLGGDRALVAITRVSPMLRIENGPRRAVFFHPPADPSVLPDHLRGVL